MKMLLFIKSETKGLVHKKTNKGQATEKESRKVTTHLNTRKNEDAIIREKNGFNIFYKGFRIKSLNWKCF